MPCGDRRRARRPQSRRRAPSRGRRGRRLRRVDDRRRSDRRRRHRDAAQHAFSAGARRHRGGQARARRKAARGIPARSRNAGRAGGEAGRPADGRSHVRVQRRGAADPRHHRQRRAGRAAVSRLGAREPRPVPDRQQRHLGPRRARSRSDGLPGRRAAGVGVGERIVDGRIRAREHRIHHRPLRERLSGSLSRQLARAGEDPPDAARRPPAHAGVRRHGSAREGPRLRQRRRLLRAGLRSAPPDSRLVPHRRHVCAETRSP